MKGKRENPCWHTQGKWSPRCGGAAAGVGTTVCCGAKGVLNTSISSIPTTQPHLMPKGQHQGCLLPTAFSNVPSPPAQVISGSKRQFSALYWKCLGGRCEAGAVCSSQESCFLGVVWCFQERKIIRLRC